MSPKTGRIAVGDTFLPYEMTGNGPVVVLLHGFALDRRLWDDQVSALAARFTVVRYDLRGFGASPPSTSPYSHADDLKTLVDALNLDRIAPIGLSMGGGAAINFTILHPDRVWALVAVDPSLGGFDWSSSFAASQQRLRTNAAAGVDEARERWLASSIFARSFADEAVGARVRQMVSAYSGWHWTHPDTGVRLQPPAIDRLNEIRVPTLVLVGEHDTRDFHAIADTIADRVAGAERVTMADAGHLLNLERPARFNEVVLRFLQSVKPI
jgi:pimeloyl-ACP methyl ester carboxylesterase